MWYFIYIWCIIMLIVDLIQNVKMDIVNQFLILVEGLVYVEINYCFYEDSSCKNMYNIILNKGIENESDDILSDIFNERKENITAIVVIVVSAIIV